MKLYNSIGPNPQVVRMFAAEKGVKLDLVPVDIMQAENRGDAHLSRNAAGQLPAFELDDGSFINEINVICEYIEELHPEPALIGRTPKERAETRMWFRRFDLNIAEPLSNGFRSAEGLPLFSTRIPTDPAMAPGLKMVAQNRMKWLSDMLGPRQWMCGDRFSLADIHLFCFLGFGMAVGQPINPEAPNLQAIFERVKARPSAAA
jgi:glutathione S-transferase